MSAPAEETASNNDTNNEFQPTYPLARKFILGKEDTFFAVEYPGYSKDIVSAHKHDERQEALERGMHAMLETLGGIESVERAFSNTGPNNTPIELRYRSTDAYSHPIIGEIVDTGNLLLKITRRRRRKKRSSMSSYSSSSSESSKTRHNKEEDFQICDISVVGTVTKTCRFRSLADFQWAVDVDDPLVKLRYSMESLDIEAIEKFNFSDDFGTVANIRHLPPPVFSRVDWALPYNYRQNSMLIKVMIDKKDGSKPEVRLTQRREADKYVLLEWRLGDPIPTSPPDNLDVSIVPKECLELVRQLFDMVPIWTRRSILEYLPPRFRTYCKKFLPLFAYATINGPWRDSWIRYGYDPRKHVKARFYQSLYLRSIKEINVYSRAKRRKDVPSTQHDSTTQKEEEDILEKQMATEGVYMEDIVESDDALAILRAAGFAGDDLHTKFRIYGRGHIFSQDSSKNRAGSYRVCDVLDSEIVPFLMSKSHVMRRCDMTSSGWYERQVLDAARRMMHLRCDQLDQMVLGVKSAVRKRLVFAKSLKRTEDIQRLAPIIAPDAKLSDFIENRELVGSILNEDDDGMELATDEEVERDVDQEDTRAEQDPDRQTRQRIATSIISTNESKRKNQIDKSSGLKSTNVDEDDVALEDDDDEDIQGQREDGGEDEEEEEEEELEEEEEEEIMAEIRRMDKKGIGKRLDDKGVSIGTATHLDSQIDSLMDRLRRQMQDEYGAGDEEDGGSPSTSPGRISRAPIRTIETASGQVSEDDGEFSDVFGDDY